MTFLHRSYHPIQELRIDHRSYKFHQAEEPDLVSNNLMYMFFHLVLFLNNPDIDCILQYLAQFLHWNIMQLSIHVYLVMPSRILGSSHKYHLL